MHDAARSDEQNADEPNPDLQRFLQKMLGSVAGTLEEIVGLEEAKGYMSLVGEQLACSTDIAPGRCASAYETGDLFVSMQRQVGGGFRVTSTGVDRVELQSLTCPFGRHVVGRPSLCMITSNMFGRLAAEQHGHVTVELAEAIARGDRRCVVRVNTAPDLEISTDNQRHFFADDRER